MFAALANNFTDWQKRNGATRLPRRPAAWPRHLGQDDVQAPIRQPWAPYQTPPMAQPQPVVQANAQLAMELPIEVRLAAVDMQRRQHLLVAETNRRLEPGCHVMAWNIVPPAFFAGDMGRFLLMACDFHVHGPANTLLLPSMPFGADQLSLPRHPLVVTEQQSHRAEKLLLPLRQRVLDEHRRALQAMSHGDLTQIFTRSDRQAGYRLELGNIARSLVIDSFGVEVFQQHEQLFRTFIKAM
jgi:hypothetical protein